MKFKFLYCNIFESGATLGLMGSHSSCFFPQAVHGSFLAESRRWRGRIFTPRQCYISASESWFTTHKTHFAPHYQVASGEGEDAGCRGEVGGGSVRSLFPCLLTAHLSWKPFRNFCPRHIASRWSTLQRRTLAFLHSSLLLTWTTLLALPFKPATPESIRLVWEAQSESSLRISQIYHKTNPADTQHYRISMLPIPVWFFLFWFFRTLKSLCPRWTINISSDSSGLRWMKHIGLAELLLQGVRHCREL